MHGYPGSHDDHADMHTELTQLRRQVAEAYKDAERFQQLAQHYEGIMMKVASAVLPKDEGGRPNFGGRSSALHILELPDRLAALERRNAALVEAVEKLSALLEEHIDLGAGGSPIRGSINTRSSILLHSLAAAEAAGKEGE